MEPGRRIGGAPRVCDVQAQTVKAVLWDFGGVIATSPFSSLAAYEAAVGLPDGLIRQINSTNPDTNAWAKLERSEVSIDEFAALFEAEALGLGHTLDARVMMAALGGAQLRPEMVEAVRRCHERLKTGLITNNFVTGSVEGNGSAEGRVPSDGTAPSGGPGALFAGISEYFDVVIESATAGIRKPDPRVYELACGELAVEPHEAVFLDDLGINLKPARSMGMRTIKVVEPEVALAELQEIVGFALS